MSLNIDKLTIRSKKATLISELSFAVNAGEILSIMGPSGIGKSTLLAAIAGHLNPSFSVSGEVKLEGVSLLSLPMEKRRVGVLFQQALLFPHLSVGQNLIFAMPKTEKNKREVARDALAAVGLKGFEDRDPATLSGGEAARVALQRAFLAKPKAILLDEPFSKLDYELREEIRALTFAAIQKEKIPALMVTHDKSDAQHAGGEILVLKALS